MYHIEYDAWCKHQKNYTNGAAIEYSVYII